MWWRYHNNQIRMKLMLSYLVVCFIPLIITVIIVYNTAVRKLEESSMEFVATYNSLIVENLQQFLDSYETMTKAILIDMDIVENLREYQLYPYQSESGRIDYQEHARELMYRLYVLYPEARNIFFYSALGEVYGYNISSNIIYPETLVSEEWLKEMVETDATLCISEVHDTSYCFPNDYQKVVSLGKKIYSTRYEYIGMLVIEIEPGDILRINESFSNISSLYSPRINIVLNDSNILYDLYVEQGYISWQELLADQDALRYLDNTREYIIFSEEIKNRDLSIHVSIPRDRLMLRVRAIRNITLFISCICLILLLVMSITLSYSITKPISYLESQMKKAEEGNYDVLLSYKSEDEIGRLIDSYNSMISKIKTLINDVYIMELKQKDARFLALQTQINPHMLYNTLESIRMKALVRDDGEVAEMIKKLAQMFRMMLTQKERYMIRDEIEYTRNYLELQNMRYPDMFVISVELSEAILDTLAIPLILQPLVENAITHGFRGYGKPLHIFITGEIDADSKIHIYVRNDGKEIEMKTMDEINYCLKYGVRGLVKEKEESNSIGLQNISERIRLYYGVDSYLYVDIPEKGVTEVEICIPVAK